MYVLLPAPKALKGFPGLTKFLPELIFFFKYWQVITHSKDNLMLANIKILASVT